MKAEELMIGDLVMTPLGDISRVTQIVKDGYGIHVAVLNDKYNYYMEGLQGIPLTAEILEANGFTRSKAFVEWKYEDDDIYMLWKPFPWIKIQLEDHTVMFPCEFVHELQHALRLCGIDKEIVLNPET